MTTRVRVTVLAGGFGGARMAHGFALLGTDAAELSVIVNTGDDLELHGLSISPDLDTVMYTLAGLANEETGWGVRDETWSASAMLERYGQPTWFGLGDRDLATHIVRTARLAAGSTLTEVTADLTTNLGISARILPMTDGRLRTQIRTNEGWLAFQEYFVKRHHTDEVLEIHYERTEPVQPTKEALAAIDGADLIVIAPSNPFLSVGPILALDELRQSVEQSRAPVLAISPIVGGEALRGPAAQIMRSLGSEPSALGIAQHYAERYPGLAETLVIDDADERLAPDIAALGIEPVTRSIVIPDVNARRALARELLDLHERHGPSAATG